MVKRGRAWNKERLRSQESPSLWSLTSTPPPLDISVLGHQDCLLDKVFQGMTKRSWKDRTVVIRRHDVETDRDLKFSSFMSLCDLCSDFRLSYSFDNVIYNHEINHQHFSHLKKNLYHRLVKHPDLSSWKSAKNSPDLIPSQCLSSNHLNAMFWEISGAHSY